MKAVKYLLNFGLSLVVWLYTTFALTMLWNWFVTPAFHVGEIGYWNMYGLVLVIRLLSPGSEMLPVMIDKWEHAMVMLNACIPEEKRPEVEGAIKKDMASVNEQSLIASVSSFAASTMSLLIGFVIHSLLM